MRQILITTNALRQIFIRHHRKHMKQKESDVKIIKQSKGIELTFTKVV